MRQTLLLLAFLLALPAACSEAHSVPSESDAGLGDTSTSISSPDAGPDAPTAPDTGATEYECDAPRSPEGLHALNPANKLEIQAGTEGDISEVVRTRLATQDLRLVYFDHEVVISEPWGGATLCRPSSETSEKQHFSCEGPELLHWQDSNFGAYAVYLNEVVAEPRIECVFGDFVTSVDVTLIGRIAQVQSDIGAWATFTQTYSSTWMRDHVRSRARIDAELGRVHPNEPGLLPWETLYVDFSDPVRWSNADFWQATQRPGVFLPREVESESFSYSTGFEVRPEGWWNVSEIDLVVPEDSVQTFRDALSVIADDPTLSVQSLPAPEGSSHDFSDSSGVLLRGDAKLENGGIRIGQHDAERVGEVVIPLQKRGASSIALRYSTWNSEPGIFGNPAPQIAVVRKDSQPIFIDATESSSIDETWSEATYTLPVAVDDPILWIRWHSTSGEYSLWSLTLDSVRAE